jgi:hypothetical protein
MTTQILNNLSLASLPVIIGAIVIGLGLTGLLLWIISRGRPHQSDRLYKPPRYSAKLIFCRPNASVVMPIKPMAASAPTNMLAPAVTLTGGCLGLAPRWTGLGKAGTSILTPRNISISLLVPALSLVIYLGIGNPQSPDRPFASRSAEITAAKAGASQNQNAAATALRDAIKATEASPNDVEAWLLLAQGSGQCE